MVYLQAMSIDVSTTTERTRPVRSERVVRRDIQALRAFAVVTVVLYHAWPSGAPGGFTGVDVFFVVSGFLITGHLIAQPPRAGRDFARFWANRALRLLPALSVVTLFVLAATRFLAPATAWSQVARDTIASTLYVQNWNLIHSGSDYLAHGSAVSPLQHFWSLSVEEQYYLGWPLLIAALTWAARGKDPKRLYLSAVGAIVATGLLTGFVLTGEQPSVAYLATHTRVWQLAGGSLLAVLIWKRRSGLTLRARRGAFWLGVAGLLAGLWLIGPATPYPGLAALLPTVATMLVLVADDPEPGRITARPLMYAPAVQWLGDVSYALYLWHWPLLILPAMILGRPLGFVETVLAVLCALVAAGLSTALVENPVRRSKLRQHPRRALMVGAVLMAIVILAAIWLKVDANQQIERSQTAAAAALRNPDDCLGAGSLIADRDCPADPPLVTSPEFAKTDQSSANQEACLNWVPYTELRVCPGGAVDGKTRVALYGNSHAGHWFPAIDTIGKELGWRVDTYIVGMCKPTATPVTYIEGIGTWSAEQLSDACAGFETSLIPHIAAQAYDVIIMSSQDYEGLTGAGDYADTFQALTAEGTQLVVIRDTPAPMGATPQADCLAQNPAPSKACDGTLSEWLVPDSLAEAATVAGVPVVDLTEYVCDGETCPAIVGGVIVFGDASHLTRTYVLTMAPMLRAALLDVLD